MWPLFEQLPLSVPTWPSMLPDAATPGFDDPVPLNAPLTRTVAPRSSRALPEMLPVAGTDAVCNRIASDCPPAIVAFASSPVRSTCTSNRAGVVSGVPLHAENEAQTPLLEHAGKPAVDSVMVSVYGPGLSETGRTAGGVVAVGVVGEP